MYKNVLNQRIVALFLWFSSCYSFFSTESQSIKGFFRRLIFMLKRYLNKCLILNQFPAATSILNSTLI